VKRSSIRIPDRIDLVALDVDGTLLRSDRGLTRRVAKTIHEANARGVHVVLASARPPRTMREIHKVLGLKTLLINYNGALIYDTGNEANVYHQPIPVDLARQVITIARKTYREVAVSIEILDRWYTDHFDETWAAQTIHMHEPKFVGPLESFLQVPVTKLMFVGQPDKVLGVRAAILNHFSGKIAVAISDRHLIQVIHPDVDKARALDFVCAMYDVKPKRVMAMGDAPNDIGMIQWAGLGVAVKNAWKQVTEAADVIVPSNDEDGVAYAINKFVLRRSTGVDGEY
jgi:Cof subfamily protein (haloacid dehalogenase superfamily)